MPLTATQYKALIVQQVGDDAAGTIAANIDTYWTVYDHVLDDYAHFLYSKITAIDVLLGIERKRVDFKALDGAEVKANAIFKNLLDMRQAALDEIALGIGTNDGQPQVGELTQTAPVMQPDTAAADANDRAYRGDPYLPAITRSV